MKTSLNLTRENKFIFDIPDLPILTQLSQSVSIETITLNETMRDGPLLDYQMPGEKLVYGNFDIMYVVDENYDGYFEVLSFMSAIAGDEVLLSKRAEYNFQASVQILDNSSSKIIRTLKFIDAWPTMLGTIELDTTGSDTKTSTVTFSYRRLEITPNIIDTTGFENKVYKTHIPKPDIFDS